MKFTLAMLLGFWPAGILVAADAKAELTAIVTNLGEQSYRWTILDRSSRATPDSRLTGKTGRDGVTEMQIENGDAGWPVFWKLGAVVIKTSDHWTPLDEALRKANAEVMERRARKIDATKAKLAVSRLLSLRTFLPPAADLSELLEDAYRVKESRGLYTIELSDEALLRRADWKPPAVAGSDVDRLPRVKGHVHVWVTNGVVTKYHIDFETTYPDFVKKRDREVTIADVGSTNVQMPEDVAVLLN